MIKLEREPNVNIEFLLCSQPQTYKMNYRLGSSVVCLCGSRECQIQKESDHHCK